MSGNTRGVPTAMRLPLPEGLPGATRIALRWTLSYVSDVSPSDASEYTGSGFEITFRPHDGKRSIWDVAAEQSLGVFDVETDRDSIAALGATRAIKIGQPASYSRWRGARRTERELRDSGKWETLIRAGVKLEASELLRPRVDVVYLTRAGGMLTNTGPQEIPVSMLVTLSAPPDVPLYDAVRAEFGVLVPLVAAEQRIQT